VSLEDIRKALQWSPATQEVPPLAPGRAQVIARKQLDRIIPPKSSWYVDAVRLVAAVEGTHWLYEVCFRREYPPDVAVFGGEYVDCWSASLCLSMASDAEKPRHMMPRAAYDAANGWQPRLLTFHEIPPSTRNHAPPRQPLQLSNTTEQVKGTLI
jgi:hypothetical protein